MPYHLVSIGSRGWKVKDDKGHYYSRNPLPKQRALAQQRALYAQTTHTGKGYTVYQMGDNTHYVMHGKGRFTEFIKKGVKKVGEFAKKLVAPGLKAVRDLTTPLTRQNAFPPKVREFIEKNKTCLVRSAYVRRFPIYAVLEKVLNFISANRFGEIKRSLGYDDMFHLSLVVGLQCADGRKFGVMIEKNEVVNITTEYKDDGAGTQLLQVPVPIAIPFGSFIQKAVESVGPSIYQYDAFNNNCQMFVRNVLQANGLLNPAVSGFVMQDSLSLVQQLPDYVGPFARVITNIAGIADRFIEGEGKPEHLEGGGVYKDTVRRFKQQWEEELKNNLRLKYPSKRSERENEFKIKDTYAGKALNLIIEKLERDARSRPEKDKTVETFVEVLDIIKRTPLTKLSKTITDPITEETFKTGEPTMELQREFPTTGRIYKDSTINDARKAQLDLYRRHGPQIDVVDSEGNIQFLMRDPPPVFRNPFTRAPVSRTDRRFSYADVESKSKVSDVVPKLEGMGFFDDVGDWFKTTFTGQRDTYPLQPLYNVVELIGEPERSLPPDAEAVVNRKIDEAMGQHTKQSPRRLKGESLAEYSKRKTNELDTFDSTKARNEAVCEWLKTPEGVAWRQRAEQWNANKKAVEDANLEIVKNNELIEAENAKIRDCNDSFGCSLKTAFTNLTDVVSWIPGPIGTIAGLANTGLSFIGDGKPKRGGRRLPPMPNLTMEQFEGMYGKAPNRDQYPGGPEGDKKYKAVIDRRQELYEARKKGISPANPTDADYIARGQKIVEMQDKRKADIMAEQQRQLLQRQQKAQIPPDIGFPKCGPVATPADRTAEYRSAGQSMYSFGRGKRCCGKCEKKGDGSCKLKGGCGACGGSNGVMKGGANVVMDKKDYLAEHKRLIALLDDIQKKVGKESKRQKAEPELKGEGVKLPFSKAEYLKKVRERANQAGYDGRAVEFSDKPAKKFMIYDDKGKKHYFGQKTYGDNIIWSAVDKEKAEQKRKAYLARATKIKGNWASDKFSPNSLAIKILWGGGN